jgi:hypothetical protein
MSEQRGHIGDIWRFDAPDWEPNRPVRHYLITAVTRVSGRYNIHYSVMELETGDIYHDLLLDDANVKNFNARKVA